MEKKNIAPTIATPAFFFLFLFVFSLYLLVIPLL